MTVQLSIVDLSALPKWPHYVAETGRVHRRLDPYHMFRMAMAHALPPPDVQVRPLRDGVLLLTRIVG